MSYKYRLRAKRIRSARTINEQSKSLMAFLDRTVEEHKRMTAGMPFSGYVRAEVEGLGKKMVRVYIDNSDPTRSRIIVENPIGKVVGNLGYSLEAAALVGMDAVFRMLADFIYKATKIKVPVSHLQAMLEEQKKAVST